MSLVAASLNNSLLGDSLLTNHIRLSPVSIALFHLDNSVESKKFFSHTAFLVSSGIKALSCLPLIPNVAKPTRAFSIDLVEVSFSGGIVTDTSM